MINYVNEAINRKLASISFTTIVSGLVTSIDPLKIKINDRITIGLDFIEPMSLGINDDSPSPALPFIVGDKLQLIRYNSGQRFYVLNGKVGNYSTLSNKPVLNTSNTSSQTASSAEEINGTIKLHKISKTGNYNDCLNRPIVNYQVQGKLKDARGIYLNEFNGRITSANFTKTAANYGTIRYDLVTSSMTTANGKPASDGYVQTYFWDNSGRYDSQLFIPCVINGRLALRSYNVGQSVWGNWEEIPKISDVLLYDVISTW